MIRESDVYNLVTDLAARQLILIPTAVKTGNYNAAATDYVPVDTTSNSVTITLPTAPADQTSIGVKMVIQGGTNAVTINAGGSDVFNKAGGSTSLSVPVLNQGFIVQYKSSSAIWYVFNDDLPLSYVTSAINTIQQRLSANFFQSIL
jgi:hypothetical protein